MRSTGLGRQITGILVVFLAAATTMICFRAASRSEESLILEAKRASLDTAATLALSAGAWIESGRVTSLQRAADLMLLGSPVYISVVSEGSARVNSHENGYEGLSDSLRGMDSGDVILIEYVEHPILLAMTDLPLSDSASGHVHIGVDAKHLMRQIRGTRVRIGGVGAAAWLVLAAGSVFVERVRSTRARDPRQEDRKDVQVPPTSGTSLAIDLSAKRVLLLGRPVELARKPFDLLALLASEEGRVFGEREIVEHLWPEAPYADSGDVRQCIYVLRRRLNAAHPKAGACVVNVKGFGYKLDASCIQDAKPLEARE